MPKPQSRARLGAAGPAAGQEDGPETVPAGWIRPARPPAGTLHRQLVRLWFLILGGGAPRRLRTSSVLLFDVVAA